MNNRGLVRLEACNWGQQSKGNGGRRGYGVPLTTLLIPSIMSMDLYYPFNKVALNLSPRFRQISNLTLFLLLLPEYIICRGVHYIYKGFPNNLYARDGYSGGVAILREYSTNLKKIVRIFFALINEETYVAENLLHHNEQGEQTASYR